MKLDARLKEGFFLRRLNRFAALVEVDGEEALAHVPNSGRLQEIFTPGAPLLLAPRAGSRRRTAFDLALARLGQLYVSVDARVPNTLVQEALREGRLPGFQGYRLLRREVSYDQHRLDFLVSDGEPCLLEVKSITLVEEGIGLFPDAPTSRGAEHLAALLRFRQEGGQAAALFVIQREDAYAFAPHDAADPRFGQALRRAAAWGVMVRAYVCRVSPQEVFLDREVPVHL
jgi:sugar fermentation stimulation protein A